MRLVAKTVQDEQIQPLKVIQLAVRYRFHVRNVSHAPHTVAQYGQPGVHHFYGSDLQFPHPERFVRTDGMKPELGHAGIFMLHKTIRQALAQLPAVRSDA